MLLSYLSNKIEEIEWW